MGINAAAIEANVNFQIDILDCNVGAAGTFNYILTLFKYGFGTSG